MMVQFMQSFHGGCFSLMLKEQSTLLGQHGYIQKHHYMTMDSGVTTGSKQSGLPQTVVYKSIKMIRREAVDHDWEKQIVLSPERSVFYGDDCWRRLMINATMKVLYSRENPLCLVADDSIFLAICVLHFSKNSSLIPLFPGLGKKGFHYLQNVASANSFSMERIQFLKPKDLLSSLQDSDHRKINLLVAEPFYAANTCVLPWKNLRFWKLRTIVDEFLSDDARVMPCRGLLKACAMYLPDLWRSRCCLKEVEGFDHSMVNNTLGACGDLPLEEVTPFLPFSVWQCGETKVLSETVTIMEFDFSKPMMNMMCSSKTQVRFTELGTCHGFVVWIDWVIDSEGTMLSTGPDKREWKQGVKLLNQTLEVRDSVEMEACFDTSNAELSLTLTKIN